MTSSLDATVDEPVHRSSVVCVKVCTDGPGILIKQLSEDS